MSSCRPDALAIGWHADRSQLIVLSDDKPWPDNTKHTAPGSRAEIDIALRDWGKTVRGIGDLMPEKMDKWAIFDLKDFPAPQYNKGAICLAGDAAHATGPHLGAGGGLGVEDALVLAELLDELHKGWNKGGGYGRVKRALQAYSDVRYDRTQKVVQDTRQACLLFHWQVEEVGGDGEKFGGAITPKFHHVWQGDVPGMVGDALGRVWRGDKE
jgi:salicylate hydroxylase